MKNEFYIKNIEIKSMFGEEHIYWDLFQNVNILGGKNGSGKSTILKSCYSLIKDKFIKDSKLLKLSEWICISFTNGYRLTWDKQKYNSAEYQREEGFLYHLNTNDVDKDGFIILQRCQLTDASGNPCSMDVLEDLKVYLINSFEQRLLNNNPFKDETGQDRTYLDYLIHEQLFIRNSRFAGVFEELLNTLSNKTIDIRSVIKRTEVNAFMRFYTMLQEFMTPYSVMIDNNMRFIRKDPKNPLSYTDLSMGEKQLLLLLLMVNNTVNEPCIFFMDEPDLGMHVEWKEQLVKVLHKLNPNMQIILSTHAPSMVEGWYEQVKEVQQLIKK